MQTNATSKSTGRTGREPVRNEPALKILAFDTSSVLLSVALSDEGRYRELNDDSGFRHTEQLMVAVKELVGTSRVDLIICSRGPGSFTGLRIGMATAKGLAAGYDCAIVTVPTLEAWAWGFSGFPATVIPVIDARKKRYYAALFASGRRLTADLDETPAAIIAGADRGSDIVVTGPHAREFSAALGGIDRNLIVDPRHRGGIARALIELGIVRYRSGNVDADDSAPEYVRSSDAELSISGGDSRAAGENRESSR